MTLYQAYIQAQAIRIKNLSAFRSGHITFTRWKQIVTEEYDAYLNYTCSNGQ
jgi:hypothetical protein